MSPSIVLVKPSVKVGEEEKEKTKKGMFRADREKYVLCSAFASCGYFVQILKVDEQRQNCACHAGTILSAHQ